MASSSSASRSAHGTLDDNAPMPSLQPNSKLYRLLIGTPGQVPIRATPSVATSATGTPQSRLPSNLLDFLGSPASAEQESGYSGAKGAPWQQEASSRAPPGLLVKPGPPLMRRSQLQRKPGNAPVKPSRRHATPETDTHEERLWAAAFFLPDKVEPVRLSVKPPTFNQFPKRQATPTPTSTPSETAPPVPLAGPSRLLLPVPASTPLPESPPPAYSESAAGSPINRRSIAGGMPHKENLQREQPSDDHSDSPISSVEGLLSFAGFAGRCTEDEAEESTWHCDGMLFTPAHRPPSSVLNGSRVDFDSTQVASPTVTETPTRRNIITLYDRDSWASTRHHRRTLPSVYLGQLDPTSAPRSPSIWSARGIEEYPSRLDDGFE